MQESARFGAWESRLRSAAPSILIIVLWALASLPWVTLRSLILEEGKNALLARDILQRGDPLRPALFGVPWLEKPSLLPWLIASASAITGGVSEWSARVAPMASVLATALLVQNLTRRYASARASIFAGLAFLFSPMLLQKLAIAEPDTIITFLSFAAWLLWWSGAARDEVGPARWLGCGALLTILAMAKGPQPAGFFALGVGAFTLLNRRWRDLPGLVGCLAAPALAVIAWGAAVYRPGAERTWLGYMRLGVQATPLANLHTLAPLPLELLPALLVAPLLPMPWSRRREAASPIVGPLLLYTTACTAVLLVWPGANGRYAMPITPGVAVLGGLAWDRTVGGWRLWLKRAATVALIGLVVAQLVIAGVLPPLFAARYAQSRRAGRMIEAAVRADPAPLYCANRSNNQPDANELFYVDLPIHGLQPSAMGAPRPPFWFEGSTADLAALAASRPDLRASRLVQTSYGPAVVAERLERR